MKGTIKTVMKTGMLDQLHILAVEFNHTQGEKINFYSTKDLDDPTCVYKVGNEITYIVKPNGNGKLVNENGTSYAKPEYSKPSGGRPATTNDSILLQVCYKENMSAFAKENRSDVMPNTMEDFNELRNFLNNL